MVSDRGINMEFMSFFDDVIIARGYDYFTQDQVLDIEQTDTYEYRGHVAGSCDKPYSVKINIVDPKESVCDCPYAKDGHMCKHMAALEEGLGTMFYDELLDEYLDSPQLLGRFPKYEDHA